LLTKQNYNYLATVLEQLNSLARKSFNR